MPTSQRNFGLAAAQALLWLFGVGGLLALLNIPFYMDVQYWLRAGSLLTVAALSGFAAVLIRRRDRRGIALVVGIAALAILPTLPLRGGVSTVRVVICAFMISLLVLYRRD